MNEAQSGMLAFKPYRGQTVVWNLFGTSETQAMAELA